jgi:hypothetical protein
MWREKSERDGVIYEPPCETCRVTLLEENADAARIYQLTRGQIVTLGENVIDLNHVALWQAIDRYKVKEPVRVFELVNKVFHHFLAKDRENAS